MDLEFLDDPDAFLTAAGDHLAADPVVGTVVATVTGRIRDDALPLAPGQPPRWWVLLRDPGADGPGRGTVRGVGMRTAPFAPYPVFLLPMPEGGGTALARAMVERGAVAAGDTCGVNGALGPAAECAEELARLTGAVSTVSLHTRLFELTGHDTAAGFADPARAGSPSGSIRRATQTDADLVLRWFGEFGAAADAQAGRSAGHHHGEAPSPEDVLARIAAGGVWLWQDPSGRPVQLTAASPPQFGVSRIGPVYTPQEERGHGYATAAVAVVAHELAAAGVRVCLYTDQANPTSNAIYQRIGFTPVVDMVNLVVAPGS